MTPSNIEPWMEAAAYKIGCDATVTEMHFMFKECAEIIAAHAPKQEPSVPVSKLKTWRNAASIPLTYSDAVAFDELIHQAEGEK